MNGVKWQRTISQARGKAQRLYKLKNSQGRDFSPSPGGQKEMTLVLLPAGVWENHPGVVVGGELEKIAS